MSKMADRITFILEVFDIPKWYGKIMSKCEEEKLSKLIRESSCHADARLHRMLDCSAFCIEDKCYFCGKHKRNIKKY